MHPKVRRFNLGDLMILIVAVEIAMLVSRNLWQGLTTGPGAYYWEVTPFRLLLAASLSAFATPMTLACLACRLRRPRPAWRRVAILPGTAALVVCAVLFAFRIVEVVIGLSLPEVALPTYHQIATIPIGEAISLVIIRPFGGNGVIGHIEPLGCFGVLTTSFASPCGPAVAAVWLFLALSGRWRPERSWIDRLGRLLGATWIVISLLAIYPVT
jgi:hypothetical protein